MNAHSKILLPLDVDNTEDAVSLAALLQNDVGGVKVGLELVNSAGFDIFPLLRDTLGDDARIFYDCKLHDIPNTVRGAARGAARRDVWALNVHASGGKEMMKAAVAGVEEGARGQHRPLVLAVTVLTSIDVRTLSNEVAVSIPLRYYVTHLARLALESGCDGVVTSPHEVAPIRQACGPDFVIVTPGVRPVGMSANDQRRVMTPRETVAAGANYMVVGRPITQAPDPAAAAHAINQEVGNSSAG